MINADEIAEPARQPLGLNRRRLVRRGDARAHDNFLVQRALGLGQNGDEGIVESSSPVLASSSSRSRGDDLAVIHRHQPVEARSLVHVGGGDHHTHLRTPGADSVDRVPELPPRQRIDAGSRLIENQQIRIVDQRAAQAEFLLHAAGKLACRSILEWIERSGGEQFGDPRAALGGSLAEQPTEEVDVLNTLRVG